MIIYYYTFQLTADIILWFTSLTIKRLFGFITCVAFGLACAFGIGLPVVFLTSTLTCYLKIQNVLYSFGGKDKQGGITALLSNSRQNNQAMSSNAKLTKRPKNKPGKENCSFGETEPPSKRRCKVDDKHTCGPCTVWIQMGSKPEQLHHHEE